MRRCLQDLRDDVVYLKRRRVDSDLFFELTRDTAWNAQPSRSLQQSVIECDDRVT